jgi:hypothetical protein
MNVKTTYAPHEKIDARLRDVFFRCLALNGLTELGYEVLYGPDHYLDNDLILGHPAHLLPHQGTKYAALFFKLKDLEPVARMWRHEWHVFFGGCEVQVKHRLPPIPWSLPDVRTGDEPNSEKLIQSMTDWLEIVGLPTTFIENGLTLLEEIINKPWENPVLLAAKLETKPMTKQFRDMDSFPTTGLLEGRNFVLNELKKQKEVWLQENGFIRYPIRPNWIRDCIWAAWRLIENGNDKRIADSWSDKTGQVFSDATVGVALRGISTTLGINLSLKQK